MQKKNTSVTTVKYDKISIWDALMQKYLDSSYEELDPKQMVKITIEELMQISEEYHEYSSISFTEEEYMAVQEAPQEPIEEADETLQTAEDEVSQEEIDKSVITPITSSLETPPQETSQPAFILSTPGLVRQKESKQTSMIPGKQPRPLEMPKKEEMTSSGS